jgi:hypothetical protein
MGRRLLATVLILWSIGCNGPNGNFTEVVSRQTYSISGTISGGTGATVTLSGAASATTTANSSGNYSFTGLANGAYTVTPSKNGYTFSPASQSVTLSGANQTAINFTGTAQTWSISGTISGGAGATVTLSGAASATTTANSSGNYSFTGLANGTYTVTPSNAGFTFSPATQTVTLNGGNATAVNFTATSIYTISGSLSPAPFAAGATVTLSGPVNATTTANGSGNYSFSGLPAGSYTVTPSSQIATFSPTSQNLTISSSSLTGVDFTATSSANIVFFDNFPGTTLSSEWTIISRHGEYSQNETECNIPQQVAVDNGLTITAAAETWTCGDFYPNGTVWHTPSAWPYITGDIQWASFNLAYGTVEIRAQFPSSATDLWPALWMLGQNCQATNPYTGETGVGSCPSLGSTGYAEMDLVECFSGTWCQFNLFNPGEVSSCQVQFPVDTNWHIYTTDWTSSGITEYQDGTPVASCSQNVNASMFLIMQIQTGGIGGTPNNALLPATLGIDYVRVTQP